MIKIKKIFITNMTSDLNKGDLAILEGTIHILKRFFPKAKIVIQNCDYSLKEVLKLKIAVFSSKLCDEHFGSFFPRIFSTKILFGDLITAIKNLFISFWIIIFSLLFIIFRKKIPLSLLPKAHRHCFKSLTESELIIVKGGCYIYSVGGIKWFLFLYRMLYTTLLALILQKKKIILLGHSIGPIKGIIQRNMTKIILKRVDRIILRENLSFYYLKRNLKIIETKMNVSPDLAFLKVDFYENEKPNSLNSIIERENIPYNQTDDIFIGITVRDWSFPGKKNPELLFKRYINAISKIVDYLCRNKNIKIFFFPHSLYDDLKVAKRVIKLVKNTSNVYILRGNYTTNNLRNMLSFMKILIGTRIHSNILALTAGTPVVAISYLKHKGYGILKMAGFEKFVIDISEINITDLRKKVDLLLNNNEFYRSIANNSVLNIQNKIINDMQNIFLFKNN